MNMAILIKNIKEIILAENKPRLKVSGSEMADLLTIPNGWLLVDNGCFQDFGTMEELAGKDHEASRIPPDAEVIDATGRMVLPSFCDSHTHLVYAGSREIEYIDKIKGLSYEEIARRGGGILNSARRLHERLRTMLQL